MSRPPVAAAPSRAFRLGVAALALLAWAAVLLLARHRSAEAVVLGRYSTAFFVLLLSSALGASFLSIALRPPLLARLHAARWSLLAALSSLVLGVAASELLLRQLDFLGASYYREMRRYIEDRVPDAELVYRQPASASRRYQEVEVRTNALGFRDRAVGPRAPGELRILMLGDSVTFGWGVEQEKTFSARIERRLGRELGRPVRVINAGVCSYNTVQQLALFRRHRETLRPDFVFLLYVPNDVIVHSRFDSHVDPRSWWERPPSAKLAGLLRRLWLYRVTDHLLLRRLAGGEEAEDELDPASPGWQASMTALAELRRGTAAEDIGFAVALARFQPSAAQQPLLDGLRAAAGEAFAGDAAEWFRGMPLRDLTNSAVDGHPNELGHAIYAQHIVEILLSRLEASGSGGRGSQSSAIPARRSRSPGAGS